jgi:DNA polymerase elongation subunit (family B)
MSYVDAFYDKNNDVINIVERDSEQQRQYKEYPAKHIFYYHDPKGKYSSMKGLPLTRVTCKSAKELRRELSVHNNKTLYESDIKPVNRVLADNYLNADPPKLNVAFFDIETDMQPYSVPSQTMVKIRKKIRQSTVEEISVFRLGQLAIDKDQHASEVYDDQIKQWVAITGCRYLGAGPGYASPDDAFMPITAISVHLQWLNMLICLAIPPKTLSINDARALIDDLPNTILFDTESEMLSSFLDLIQDADILSGWNSEGFDIPYTVNRVIKTLSKEDTRRFCLWNQFPKRREYEKYGKAAVTYDLIGRVHLDSLELYRKYTYEERHSYRLDAIGEMEVGETKTVYEGTLDQLYNNDFRKFIIYNRQDTILLDKLDKKLKFIELANGIAHENTVLLQTTMGAVAVTDQAIINETHRRGMIVPNRVEHINNTQAAGAYVAYPKKGIHDWVGSLDINSLYPSAIRALNMGPETVVGQLRQDRTDAYIAEQMRKKKTFAASWEGLFGSLEYESVMKREKGTDVIIDWEAGNSDTLSAAQAYDLIFESNQPWMLSANGTIFTYEVEGVIPGLLKRWYSERKVMQAKLTGYLDLKSGIPLPARLKTA